MTFNTLNVIESKNKMDLWKEDSSSYLEHELDTRYSSIREQLINAYDNIDTGKKYTYDYRFGLALYDILFQNGFTVRDASDDNKWRFLSLCVVPDIVGKRWGKLAEIRYYKQSARIWLKTIWWYIHLSWQGSTQETQVILRDNTTDQILQLVDRSGKKGYYVDAYRRIMYYYWRAKTVNELVGEDDFRHIMTLHTALCRTIEPGLYKDGYDGYVRMLFDRLGVDINE